MTAGNEVLIAEVIAATSLNVPDPVTEAAVYDLFKSARKATQKREAGGGGAGLGLEG